MLDCDQTFTEMFGYTRHELLGNSVLDQIHPDDQGRAVESWLAVLSTRRDQQTRLRRKRKDGSSMWVDTTLHNLLHDAERACVLVEIIDISAEMQAQEALQERDELLRRLTAAMPAELGASVGVACSEGAPTVSADLVKRADAAMYESKEHGQCLPVLAPTA